MEYLSILAAFFLPLTLFTVRTVAEVTMLMEGLIWNEHSGAGQ